VTSILQNIRSALESLKEHASRAVLSAVGIMVASMAIVLLISIARGVQDDISKEVRDLGVNIVIVLPARIEEGSMFAPGLMGISYLRESHIEEVRKISGIGKVVPLTFVGSGLAIGDKKSPSTLIIGTKPDWFDIRATKMQQGRTLLDSDANSPVCVIGSVPYHKLFGNETAVGKTLVYNGQKYKIIGVTEDRVSSNSTFSMGSFENTLFVPYEYIKSKQPQMQIDRIVAQTIPTKEPKQLVASMEAVLGNTLAHETYSVVTQEDLLKIVFKIMDILTWLLVGLTSIALVVGGVGIMTIMLMSVNERTKEIGVRKTVGARGADLFIQFLTESICIGFVGAAMGLVVSWIASLILAALTPIKPLITSDIVVLAFAVCIGVGCVFGLIPALRAARKDPVVSLRTE
jgi:putative ABC transport system permease protein